MTTFATPEPITAKLTVAGAQVKVSAGDHSQTVVEVDPANRANAKDVKVAENTSVKFSDGKLTIRTNVSGQEAGSVVISIALPAGSGLSLTSAWSSVRAEGALGACDLNLASGQVELDEVADLEARLADGEVKVGQVAGSSSIDNSLGSVRLGRTAQAVRYKGSTGSIWIGHALADVELQSASGRLDIDRAEGSITAKAADCPIRIGSISRGQVDLNNYSGGIDVGVSEGSAAWIDAKSSKGEVHSSLPSQDNPDGFSSKVRIFARAKRDDIVVHRAGIEI